MTEIPGPTVIVLRALAARLPEDNDAGVTEVGEYLIKLLETLWEEKAAFSGKRPFGNSSWEYDLYVALINAGLVPGTMDDDGYVETVDEDAADQLIGRCIRYLSRSFDA